MIMRIVALGLGVLMLCPAPAKAFNASCLISKRVMLAAAVVAAGCMYRWYRNRRAAKSLTLQRPAKACNQQAQFTVGCLVKNAHMEYREINEFEAQCNKWRDSESFTTRKNIFDLAITNLEKRPCNKVVPTDRIRLSIASKHLFSEKEMSGKYYQEVSSRLDTLMKRQ